jgi:predicted transposase YbfD/YdcC
VERRVGKYNQQGEHGEGYTVDGKAVRGMRKQDEEGSEYLLSVYDVKHRKVLAQVEVGRKENEITKAPKALESVEISQKVVTGDAMHTPKSTVGTDCETRWGLRFSSQRKPVEPIQKHPIVLCARISEGWIWEDRDRFRDGRESQ